MTITDIDSFLQYYGRIRERTLRVIACIPEGKLDWSYRPGKFTFGDLIRHIAAIERFMYAENAQGKPSRYPGHTPDICGPYSAPVDYMNAMHRESLEIFKQLSAAELQRKVETPAGIPITLWKWLRAMAEHEIHHRGQLYLYCGILGVDTPPLYGLNAEQVQARSL